MTTAKVFMTGRSQAVRLPKEFRFEGTEVEIFRRGDDVILREKPVTVDRLFKVLAQMPNDFYAEERVDEPPQEREEF
ncbi:MULTISPECIES: antitoxin [Acinetobacter]|jgi:antitoxin VapB|uniref:Type II toxin-antitoxin system VapB family antitoxin n=1 Tax=Acinetobacter johnsonii TaxID=40214 RepID=A0AAJ6IG53_ACIJO|nr:MULTISPECIES: type II toxin-antitoxin system VapB family antitoxin [Acinetobacter]ALV72033.1 virulence factor [Acinetobacter johnsonii XBB1]MBB4809829.1 antitoxin VapB [Acinetobacter johnsonii]MBO7704384.1 AbrB/MazE/SpoVT family DNA-binding domain-containing protein [Acinetobacter sp.]MCV2451520.1 type II toxin-antitoxin system VapB family antitoxin [Acinetobacter johnsonii]MDG9785468.1 type II toxin-antitoxin system VapB family antitoxin [Acinetobacter johnsonii]